MNNRQRKTLAAVFADPASPSIEWSAIESMLVAAGCTVHEGTGSRVRFECRGVTFAAHRPHPRKEAKQYQVRAVREYLLKLEITP